MAFNFLREIVNQMNVAAYIDYFNLYHARLQHSELKWLDLAALVETFVRPPQNLISVKVFAARPKPLHWDPQRAQSHSAHFEALQTDSRVEVFYGRFRVDRQDQWLWEDYERIQRTWDKSMRPRTITVARTEEKGTDVNLAIHLLRDAFEQKFDRAIVLSNDSDLAPAILMARTYRPEIITVSPERRRPKQSRELARASHALWEISEATLRGSQFDHEFIDNNGRKHAKPPVW